MRKASLKKGALMSIDSLSDAGTETRTVAAHRPTIRGTRHMVVAGHYLAAHAGFHILEAGGNAVDAGVAAGIALGVLQSDLVNVAGGGSNHPVSGRPA